MKQNSKLNHFQQLFFILVLQKWERPPKPLLGYQNWVIKAGWCHSLVLEPSGAGVVRHM